MENKHTPGPWHVASGSVYSETGATIAHMFREPENTIRPVERDTNAALIAAAPELLYAAIAALDCLERPHAERDENRVRVMLDVAVAKAEGRA